MGEGLRGARGQGEKAQEHRAFGVHEARTFFQAPPLCFSTEVSLEPSTEGSKGKGGVYGQRGDEHDHRCTLWYCKVLYSTEFDCASAREPGPKYSRKRIGRSTRARGWDQEPKQEQGEGRGAGGQGRGGKGQVYRYCTGCMEFKTLKLPLWELKPYLQKCLSRDWAPAFVWRARPEGVFCIKSVDGPVHKHVQRSTVAFCVMYCLGHV